MSDLGRAAATTHPVPPSVAPKPENKPSAPLHPAPQMVELKFQGSSVVYKVVRDEAASAPSTEAAPASVVTELGPSPLLSLVETPEIPVAATGRGNGGAGAVSGKRSARPAGLNQEAPPAKAAKTTKEAKAPKEAKERSAAAVPNKGKSQAWTPEEEERARELVKLHGSRKWALTAQALPGRTLQQVYARWRDYLQPGISNEPWTDEEQQKLMDLHQQYGPKW